MLIEVCRHLSNFFTIDNGESGEFTLQGGEIAVKGKYAIGQFIAIKGSLFNDKILRIESIKDGVISFVIPRELYPEWVRPTGTIGLYPIGARVTHSGERFISLVDNNSWEPGVIGSENLWAIIHDDPDEHITVDETFTGTIYGLRIPSDFLRLVDEIKAFSKSPTGQASNITSSRFGIQSVDFATDASGNRAGWETVYAKGLNNHRRYNPDIKI